MLMNEVQTTDPYSATSCPPVRVSPNPDTNLLGLVLVLGIVLTLTRTEGALMCCIAG